MAKLRFKIAMSLDGYTAGPEQSKENPLGIGGMRLHEWVFPLAVWRAMHGLEGGEVNESTRVVEESLANIGATIMGRNMFGGHPGFRCTLTGSVAFELVGTEATLRRFRHLDCFGPPALAMTDGFRSPGRERPVLPPPAYRRRTSTALLGNRKTAAKDDTSPRRRCDRG